MNQVITKIKKPYLIKILYYECQILARKQVDRVYSTCDWPDAGSCSFVSHAFVMIYGTILQSHTCGARGRITWHNSEYIHAHFVLAKLQFSITLVPMNDVLQIVIPCCRDLSSNLLCGSIPSILGNLTYTEKL